MNRFSTTCLAALLATMCASVASIRAADTLPPAEPVTPPLLHTTQVHSVTFSPTGRQVATGDEKAAYLSDAVSKRIAELPRSARRFTSRSDVPQCRRARSPSR